MKLLLCLCTLWTSWINAKYAPLHRGVIKVIEDRIRPERVVEDSIIDRERRDSNLLAVPAFRDVNSTKVFQKRVQLYTVSRGMLQDRRNIVFHGFKYVFHMTNNRQIVPVEAVKVSQLLQKHIDLLSRPSRNIKSKSSAKDLMKPLKEGSLKLHRSVKKDTDRVRRFVASKSRKTRNAN